MLRTIDNLLVKLSFKRAELEQIQTRKFWYVAILGLTGLAAWAVWMAVKVWVLG